MGPVPNFRHCCLRGMTTFEMDCINIKYNKRIKKAITSILFYTLPIELKEGCSLNVKLESSTWRWVVIISGGLSYILWRKTPEWCFIVLTSDVSYITVGRLVPNLQAQINNKEFNAFQTESIRGSWLQGNRKTWADVILLML